MTIVLHGKSYSDTDLVGRSVLLIDTDSIVKIKAVCWYGFTVEGIDPMFHWFNENHTWKWTEE